jgi:predicted transcriptional regulator of viral defense system
MDEVDKFKTLIDVARSQSGFFTRGQSEYLGLSSLERHERQGDVESWDRAIYRLSGFNRSTRDDLYVIHMALVDHDGWPATAFSHQTALYLHQLIAKPDRIHCRPLRKVNFRQHIEGLILDKRTLPAETATKIDGLWVTDLPTTFVDLLNSPEDHRILVAEAVADAANVGSIQPADFDNVPSKHREFLLRSAGWLKVRERVS